jgi:hypothetical protein
MAVPYTPSAQITGLYPPVGIDGDYAIGFNGPVYSYGLSQTPAMRATSLLFLTQVEDGQWSITQTIAPPPRTDNFGQPLEVAWQTSHLKQGVCGAIASAAQNSSYLYVYERSVGVWTLKYSIELQGTPQAIKVSPTKIAIKYTPLQ